MIIEGLITFLGLIIGLFIGKYTKGEIKSGKKYFSFSYRIVLFFLFLISLYFAWYANIFHFLLAFVAGMIFSIGIKNIYFYLGLLFVLSFWGNETFFFIVATLIFIFGIIHGGLIIEKFSRVKNIRNKIINSLILFAIPFILIYFKDFALNTSYILFAFISGAIFLKFIKKLNL
ncbi:hypothetical protein HOG16_00195 [Candidatus Woesearchaeota archaeon]|jgi:hypothetical protein|nr:hypothetical protein [Candidatus Woesearchaeota archaeon]MBT4321780.1 hypothetical protein [Candidatus Woesearchaeota archaeon]MBT4631140.1 hypothetical protein [Candidatus Woesearchaeota archaeon]